jgi:uncharacterized protein YgiM (DUF1202 family)
MVASRRFVRLLLLLFALAIAVGGVAPAFAAAPPAAQATPTAYVNTGALNVRTGPGSGYGVIAVIYYGQSMVMLTRSSGGNWVRVRLPNGLEGWVGAPAIQPSVAVNTLPINDALVNPPAYSPAGTIVAKAANMRTGPAQGFALVTTLYEQQAVPLLGRNGNTTWLKVRAPNGQEAGSAPAWLCRRRPWVACRCSTARPAR